MSANGHPGGLRGIALHDLVAESRRLRQQARQIRADAQALRNECQAIARMVRAREQSRQGALMRVIDPCSFSTYSAPSVPASTPTGEPSTTVKW
jgi:hypothetical protein